MNESQDQTMPQVGECWGYQTRLHETESYIVIRKVEDMPKLGQVWHVSIFDLAVKNPTIPEKPFPYILHVAISEEQLLESLTQKLDRSIPDKDWEEGYNIWLKGDGGAFSVPLSECVTAIEEVINR